MSWYNGHAHHKSHPLPWSDMLGQKLVPISLHSASYYHQRTGVLVPFHMELDCLTSCSFVSHLLLHTKLDVCAGCMLLFLMSFIFSLCLANFQASAKEAEALVKDKRKALQAFSQVGLLLANQPCMLCAHLVYMCFSGPLYVRRTRQCTLRKLLEYPFFCVGLITNSRPVSHTQCLIALCIPLCWSDCLLMLSCACFHVHYTSLTSCSRLLCACAVGYCSTSTGAKGLGEGEKRCNAELEGTGALHECAAQGTQGSRPQGLLHGCCR